MKLKSHIAEQLITSFLLDEASREDIVQLEQWIGESEENRKHFLEMQQLWASIEIDQKLDEDQLAGDWGKVLKKSGLSGDEKVELKNRRFDHRWITRVAAVFILGFTVSWALFQGIFGPSSKDLAYNEISTPKGSNSTILLPDGSKVWLNAGSTIKYPQVFSGKNKEVFLEGEAYFEVESDKRNNFRVITDEITVQVHGTIFNVRSYPEDQLVETTLVEGEISVIKNLKSQRKKSDPIILKPKQRIVLYKSEVLVPEIKKRSDSVALPQIQKRTKAKLLLAKNVDTERFTSWKDGQLIIKSEPMEKLAVQLERRYNVKIHFENENIKQVRYSGTIEDETVEQVMAAMELASPINYRIKDRDIWIDFAQKDSM
jgi:ferric-dicitrate binding protein FerR (iron transport regulator)